MGDLEKRRITGAGLCKNETNNTTTENRELLSPLDRKLKEFPGIYTIKVADLSSDDSYRGEMAGLKVKSHLESLMGTDVIKLNDREYMLSLQSRLMREYETVMDKQEELRSEKERRRQRRLYIEGLQELPNIDMKTPRGKSHHAGAGGTSKSSTSRHPDQRQSTLLNGSVDSDEDEDYFGHSPGNTPNPTRRKMKDVKTRRPTRYVKEPPKPSVGEESLALSLTTENRTARDRIEEDDEDLNTQRSLLMKQLRREKTVSGMYKTADLVLAAPVAELNYEAGPASGSPHGSLP